MSLNNASINVDGTVSTTGGTATTMKVQSNFNDAKGYLEDGASFEDLTRLIFNVKEPRVQSSAPNGYTQKRATAIIHKPLALDNGKYTINSMKIELSVDKETTDAEVDSLRVLGAQLIHDPDFQDFWRKLLLA